MATISMATVESLAPDQAALNEAHKLVKSGKWVKRARSADGSFVWGECQGSGSAPYRLAASLHDLGYRCSCPSRKLPCKHVLALLWFAAEKGEALESSEPPEWVLEWQMRRRAKGVPPAQQVTDNTASVAVAKVEAVAEERDEKAIARATAQRERLKAEREASVGDAMAELDRWIYDQLEAGLSTFVTTAADRCRAAAKRLVDAKAPGAASLLDQLAIDIFAVSEMEREDVLLSKLGGLHLLSAAYGRQDLLPPPLREDVRRLVGWSQSREELFASKDALRVKSAWTVVGHRSEIQADRLRRTETWLRRCSGSDGVVAPEFAVLIDFQPVSTPASSPFASGETFAAELVFYPSAMPLRAMIVERFDGPLAKGASEPSMPLSESLASYDRALAALPWLEMWPVAAGAVQVSSIDGDRLALSDQKGEVVLPLVKAQHQQALPLLGLEPIEAVGLWDGRSLRLLAAETRIGPWFDS